MELDLRGWSVKEETYFEDILSGHRITINPKDYAVGRTYKTQQVFTNIDIPNQSYTEDFLHKVVRDEVTDSDMPLTVALGLLYAWGTAKVKFYDDENIGDWDSYFEA